jgi:hypothetical protein
MQIRSLPYCNSERRQLWFFRFGADQLFGAAIRSGKRCAVGLILVAAKLFLAICRVRSSLPPPRKKREQTTDVESSECQYTRQLGDSGHDCGSGSWRGHWLRRVGPRLGTSPHERKSNSYMPCMIVLDGFMQTAHTYRFLTVRE